MLLDTDTVMAAAELLLEVAVRDQIEDRTDTDWLYDLPEHYKGDIHRFMEDVRTKEGEAIAYLMGRYVGAIGQAWGSNVGLVFHHMGLAHGDETEARALYLLIMSCWGHGIGLDDDHADMLQRARRVLNIPLPECPCRFDDSEFKDRILGDHLVCTEAKKEEADGTD